MNAEQQILDESFEFEVCGECGCDAEQHRVILDGLGHPFIQCKFPIAESLSESALIVELERRTEHYTA